MKLGVTRRLQAVVRDGENRRIKMIFALVEDLHDMPVRGRIEQLHDVLSRLKNSTGNLDGFIYGKNRSLIPLIRHCELRNKASCAQNGNSGERFETVDHKVSSTSMS